MRIMPLGLAASAALALVAACASDEAPDSPWDASADEPSVPADASGEGAGGAGGAVAKEDAATDSGGCPATGQAGCDGCDHPIIVKGEGFTQEEGKTVVALSRGVSGYDQPGAPLTAAQSAVVHDGAFLFCKLGVVVGNGGKAMVGYYFDDNGSGACDSEEPVHRTGPGWAEPQPFSPSAPGMLDSCEFFAP